MGSALKVEQFNSCSVEELNKHVRRLLIESRSEYGTNGYSGQWNALDDTSIHRPGLTFSSREEAIEWFCDNARKRGPILAVKLLVGAPSGSTRSLDNKIADIQEKLRKIVSLRGYGPESVREAAVKRVRSQKSKFKSCQKCESKINIRYASAHCPACGDSSFAMTAGDMKRLGDLAKKERELTEQMQSLTQQRFRKLAEQSDKSDWQWLIGADCPS